MSLGLFFSNSTFSVVLACDYNNKLVAQDFKFKAQKANQFSSMKIYTETKDQNLSPTDNSMQFVFRLDKPDVKFNFVFLESASMNTKSVEEAVNPSHSSHQKSEALPHARIATDKGSKITIQYYPQINDKYYSVVAQAIINQDNLRNGSCDKYFTELLESSLKDLK